MDIRSFFKPLNSNAAPKQQISTQNDNNINVVRSNSNVTGIAVQSISTDNSVNKNFLDSDSETSPKTTRLKKKSKLTTDYKCLFDDDDDDTDNVPDSIDKKISVRQLCNLEDKSTYSRQVNLTEYFDSSKNNIQLTTKNSSQDNKSTATTRDIKNIDFYSYLDSMDVDPNLILSSTAIPTPVKTDIDVDIPLPDINQSTNKQDNYDTEKKFTTSIKDRKFVFTGVLSTIDRDDAINAVKRLGGSVVSAVSEQIDYLVFGEVLEDGRPYKMGTKYKKLCYINKIRKQRLKFDNNAKQPIELIDEITFSKMIDGLSVPHNADTDTSPKIGNLTLSFDTTLKEDICTNVSGEKIENTANFGNNCLTMSQKNSSLWVDKYAPRSIEEFVSNQLQLKKLMEWLKTWKNLHSGNSDNKKRDRSSFKCALLSGPPGVGKTTSARLIVASCGYSILEFNASDQRNKQAIEQIAIMATGGITLNFDYTNKLCANTCIVMDEVDGISSGDRGGSQAIHRLIENSICPIICICNDRNLQKIRSLANKCLDLKFSPPSKMLLVQRLKKICQCENITVNDNTLNSLCDSRQGDIRQCINALQFSSNSKTPFMAKSTSALVEELKLGEKDNNLITSPFDITQRLFSPQNPNDLTFTYILDYFFIDYDMVPLMIHENYIKFIKDSLISGKKWSALCTAAEAFVIGDVIHKHIYNTQQFVMLPELGYITAVLPVVILKSLYSGRLTEKLDFPKWLGRVSANNKNKRMLQEFCISASGKIGIYGTCITDGLHYLIYQKVMKVLIEGNMDKAIELMLELGVTRDFLVDGYSGFLFNEQENLYEKLPSKTKAAFTRKYNLQTMEINGSKGTHDKIRSQMDDNDYENFVVSDEEL